MKDMICIVCPVGCHLHVDDQLQVTGNGCIRGVKYALAEITNPMRILTTTVKTNQKDAPRLSVKSSAPLPKNMIVPAVEFLTAVMIDKSVKIGDCIVSNILNTGVNIVATKNLTINQIK